MKRSGRTLDDKVRTTWQEVRYRLTGLSIWGAQWNPPEPEQKVVRDLLIFLGDRRMLFNSYDLEVAGDVVWSLGEIRKELVKALRRLGDDARANGPIRQMSGASHRFLDGHRPEIRFHGPGGRDFGHGECGPEFFVALGELRATFGRSIAELSAIYEVDVSPTLDAILPMLDDGC